jgi:hypothetical protein
MINSKNMILSILPGYNLFGFQTVKEKNCGKTGNKRC